MVRSLILIMLLCAVDRSWSQIPKDGARLWLRADTLVSFVTRPGGSEQLATWGSLVGGYTCPVVSGGAITKKPINGKQALLFNGASHLEGPSVFPVAGDYTVYLVFEWNGIHSANNFISGQSRALFTSQPGQATLLHSGDFNSLVMSESAFSGPTVIKVTYIDKTRQAIISYNGKETASGQIPVNVDSVIFIGAYQGGYCLNGTLAEVMLYNKVHTPAERTIIEDYLYKRYNIVQYKEPTPDPVAVLQAPKSMAVLEPNRAHDIVYRVNTPSVRSVVVRTETYGLPSQITTYDVSVGSIKTIPWTSAPSGFDASSVIVMADTGGASLDTVYVARDIVSGVAFTVTGQSNSIFGDGALLPSAWARTFGKNFSSSASDTVFYGSKTDGNGGGAHVGAWGLHLQNAMADQMGTPSLCINGGVGGTRIEQHLPDANNRLNRATIYGSWLYRVIKSGRQNDIRWLFWYQGESNHSSENYAELFEQLYTAWKQDLPNLQYVVVVQIRPGCAGPNHAKLRDEQRRLEQMFPNVIVHAASALPAHDGCHYGGQGYGVLGSQLFEIYRRNELGMQPGVFRSSPAVRQAAALGQNVIRVDFDRALGLRMTSDVVVAGKVRTPNQAWFANNDAKLHPESVTVQGSSVLLRFSLPVTSVSYVPDYAYDDGSTIFQGPWLVNEDGVGALTFHDVAVTTTDVSEEPLLNDNRQPQIMIHQSALLSHDFVRRASALYDLSGVAYATDLSSIQSLLPGMYTVIVNSQPRCFVVVP
jgi:hypothetical protein